MDMDFQEHNYSETSGVDVQLAETQPTRAANEEGSDIELEDEVEETLSDEDASDPRTDVLQNLETLALNFLRQLRDCTRFTGSRGSEIRKRKVSIELRDRQRDSGIRRLSYPGRINGQGFRSLAQVLAVVDALHEAVTDQLPVTKRDIYYRNPELFKSQGSVDLLVDDIAATLSVGRNDLYVRASVKGLFCGSALTIHLREGQILTGSNGSGSIIPDVGDIVQYEVSPNLSWVLVVEKEAVFQTLCGLDFAAGTPFIGPGIILTGKGYPDFATRQLLKSLSDNLPAHIPVVGLVDCDPYGLDILSVYKFGSSRLRHESGNLVANRLEWIGLSIHDIQEYHVDTTALLQVSKNDEHKARQMLNRPDESMPVHWRQELQAMLDSGKKAEIEILCDVDQNKKQTQLHPLAHYLEAKLSEVSQLHELEGDGL